MRNYTSKLTTLARNSKYPLRVRKFIITNILRFRSDVTKAAKHWRNLNDLTMSQKIKGRCIILNFFYVATASRNRKFLYESNN